MKTSYIIVLCSTIAALPQSLFAVDGPAWWTSGDSSQHVIDTTKPENNTSPATLGQAAWMAVRLHEEFGKVLPGGAGFAFGGMALVRNIDDSQHSPINLGQLKTLAKPFYDRLNAVAPGFVSANLQKNGLTSGTFPWGGTASNKSVATIGQVKVVFGIWLELDDDEDGMLDVLEYSYFGNLTQTAYSDYDNDGVNTITEMQYGTDPTDVASGIKLSSTLKLSATIRSSPQKTERDAPFDVGWADDPLKFEWTFTKDAPLNWAQDFDEQYWTAPNALVLVKNSMESITVNVANIQQGMNVKIKTYRDPKEFEEHGMDTLTCVQANATTASVKTDQRGSHLIVAFNDKNNNNVPNVGEAAVVIPVICIQIEFISQASRAEPDHVSVINEDHGGLLSYVICAGSDPPTGEVYNPADHKVGMHLQATVALIGGDVDGMRGLDRINGGWLGNMVDHTSYANYSHGDGVLKLVSNRGEGSRQYAGIPVFVSNDANPDDLVLPILDCFVEFPGSGSEIMISKGRPDFNEEEALGQKRTLFACDSPKLAFPVAHLTEPIYNGSLNQATFIYVNITFHAYLCFWGSATVGDQGVGALPAHRTYHSVYCESWKLIPIVDIPELGITELTKNPIYRNEGNIYPVAAEVQTLGGEVRPPSANFSSAYDYSN